MEKLLRLLSLQNLKKEKKFEETNKVIKVRYFTCMLNNKVINSFVMRGGIEDRNKDRG